MKKILALVLAVAMVLSIGVVAAFAAEPSMTAVPDKDSYAKDDIIKVDFVVDGVSNVAAAKIQLKFDTTKLAVWAPVKTGGVVTDPTNGALATGRGQVFVERTDKFDEDTLEGFWLRRALTADLAAGVAEYAIGLEPSLPEAKTGVAITEPFVVATVYFKAIEEGDATVEVVVSDVRTKSSIVNEIVDGKVTEAPIVSKTTTIKIGEGGETPKPSTVIAKINTVIPEEVESVDKLPNPVSVTLDDNTTIDVTVIWTENEDGTITGTVEGYTFAEGVSLSSKIKKEEPVPSTVIAKINDTIPEEVESVDDLPKSVSVTLDDDTVISVEVKWEVAEDGTITGTVEGFTFAEGASLTSKLKEQGGDEPVEPGKYPVIVNYTASRPADAADKMNIRVTLSLNEEYDGDIVIDEDTELTVIYTVFSIVDGVKEPVAKGVQKMGTTLVKNIDGFKWEASPLELSGDVVAISVVKDFDWDKAIGGDNLGTPVTDGVDAIAD